MSFWGETGRRHGLKADSGLLLGGNAPGIADIVTATLWSTMTDHFSKIAAILLWACALAEDLRSFVGEETPRFWSLSIEPNEAPGLLDAMERMKRPVVIDDLLRSP